MLEYPLSLHFHHDYLWALSFFLQDGQTPLIRAIQEGHEKIVEVLEEAGVDLKGKDKVCKSWKALFCITDRLAC